MKKEMHDLSLCLSAFVNEEVFHEIVRKYLIEMFYEIGDKYLFLEVDDVFLEKLDVQFVQ